jgi:hypothetical protein
MRIYVWDPAKAASNLRKHGIRFQEAVAAFDDPHALSLADRAERGEQRWQTIGMIDGFLLLFIAHTEEDDDGDEIARIISARHASRQERRRYEAAIGARYRS